MSMSITEAILAAVSSSLIAQLADLADAITGPESPKRVLEDGAKVISLIESWGKASEQIQKISDTALRDKAQQRLDGILRMATEGEERYKLLLEQRRERVFWLLANLRLARLGGLQKRVWAFGFYVSLVLFVQSFRMYVAHPGMINPWTLALFGVPTVGCWLAGSPRKSNTRPSTTQEEKMVENPISSPVP
jgi:hypothetical protein